ncbi:PREDICTED: retinol dehydrogenase 12-like [Nicrophorus vespilloides]|uniref:Retinol dehydrogenase 12-like n=1 Tax=Nicrophorus vespilloides TaxID=110193 RepID=A0ABM1M0T5_NICVS|nr:PREDICTED: retinol dehydrogenase 12-like [Nicrophorus vespilloides]
MWKYVSGAIAVGSIAYGLMRYFAGGVCHCTARLDGLVVIITGANSGLGKALAFELAKRGAILVLACRDLDGALTVKTEILSQLEYKAEIHVKHLDLNSFSSIIKFAKNIDAEFEEVYALVNNAGVFYHPQSLTQDGFDVTFQTNYLGPFLLTQQLTKVLKRADHARIINLCSDAHRNATAYDLTCLMTTQTEFRSHFLAYSVSKLALLLFTREYAKRISNTNIVINAVDPGNVETNIYRHFPQLCNSWLYCLQWPIRKIVVKNPYQGIQSILHMLLTSNHSTGQYVQDCKPVVPSQYATNPKLTINFYDQTQSLLENSFSESDC